MTRDSNIVKRNAFVIPGGLLAAVCLVAMLYGIAIRPDNTECGTGARMLLWGQCYHVANVLAPPFVLGAFLAVFGAVRYRSEPEDLEGHLHFGTGTHFTLSFLIAMVGVPILSWIALKAIESRDGQLHSLVLMGVQFEITFLLELIMLLGLLMLGPFLGLFLLQGHMRREFLTAAQAMSDAEAAIADAEAEQYLEDDEDIAYEEPEESSEAEADSDESWQPAQETAALAPSEATTPTRTAQDVFDDPDAAPLADDPGNWQSEEE